jgi:hypothetical protein
MAKVRAGDIRQLTVNNREMTVKGGDSNVDISTGKFNNEANSGGNGDMYITQRRKIPGFTDCPIVLDDTKQDLEYLQGISDNGEPVDVNMTLASGIVYSGPLSIVGELGKKTGDGTCSLEMRGDIFEQL